MGNENTNGCSKLIMAVLQGEDSTDTIAELNKHGFFVTVLSSTGGFLKKKSSTIMIGVEESRLDEVMALLKQFAGKRTQTLYLSTSAVHGVQASMMPLTPVETEMGGVTTFVMNLEKIDKF